MSSYKLSKVVQVTPGNIPIPTKGWGAVEKIIWEYKKQLDYVGYETSIAYADEVQNEPGQLVHVHMANLANSLHSRGIEYTFSLHDHHVEHFGKDSQCYKDNYEAIKNAKLAFVHSPHLVDYFDRMPNIVYLQHGANLNEYSFRDRSAEVRRELRLVMMANNGLGGDPLFDRKGFLLGIEAAKELDAEITIVCPGSNRQFFEHHLPDYDKLSVLYDLDHEAAAAVLDKKTIFLNPSMIEAGHPNLTVTESIACGLPVVGTSFVDMPGLVKCQPDVPSVVKGILDCLKKYDSLVEQIRRERYRVSWDIVVTNMLQHYKRAYSVTEKSQLVHNYSSTKKIHVPKQDKSGVSVTFVDGKAFVKTSFFSEGMNAVFKDQITNTILYETKIGKTPGNWCYMWAPNHRFVDWEVTINWGIKPVHTERLSLDGKKVLVTGKVNQATVSQFQSETGAFVTTRDVDLPGICHDKNPDIENYYTTYNDTQILNFFETLTNKPDKNVTQSLFLNWNQIPADRHLLIANSAALGDTIAFVPYAQRWAEKNSIVVDTAVTRPEIFDHSKYPNLRLIDSKDLSTSSYNHIHRFEYQFDRSLQRGYSDQFGLDYEEIPAVIKKSGLKSPMRQKYAVIGVQSTAQCKYWNFPDGWNKLSEMLKKEGITPVSVDRYESFGIEGHWNLLPDKSIKKVGMEFDEVIRWIEHCEVFIGISSGLAWLAYGLGKKVVMITGTTAEGNEFEINNTVVSNRSVCNGCFNTPELHKFNSGDWLWCPKHKGTERQFECTKTITPEMVMSAIKECI